MKVKSCNNIFRTLLLLLAGCGVFKKEKLGAVHREKFSGIDPFYWEKADHSFINNLASFNRYNVESKHNTLILNLTDQKKDDKDFSGAEIRSKQFYKYGKFTACLKPACGAGIVTGFFLYNPNGSPNHEIDIEFAGNDCSKIHFNYYTSAKSNTKTVQLNFDASKAFHEYSIVWLPNAIKWEVDGVEIYSTRTAIPTQALKLMFNLWISKPNEWAGTFNPASLPQKTEVQNVRIYSSGDF